MELPDVDATMDRLSKLPGVHGLIVSTRDAVPIKTTLDNTSTVTYSTMLTTIDQIGTSLIREVDPTDSLVAVRIRTNRHEILLKPDPHYMVICVQRLPKPEKMPKTTL